MFQKKVIEKVRSQAVDSESDHDTEDITPVSHKRAKVEVCDDELQREKDALEIQEQHEKFMEAQRTRAEQFVKKERKLLTVSSKLPMVDSTDIDTCRPGMAGKGPRHIPQSVKNYRRKLKKKHSRTKQQQQM